MKRRHTLRTNQLLTIKKSFGMWLEVWVLEPGGPYCYHNLLIMQTLCCVTFNLEQWVGLASVCSTYVVRQQHLIQGTVERTPRIETQRALVSDRVD